jgi:hypothetical protein
MRRRIVFVCLASCNALTGVGKYDVNDCPNGECADGGGTDAQSDAGASDGANAADTATGGDAAADASITCTQGKAPLTVIVGAIGESVNDTSNGTSIPPSTTRSYCATPSDQYRLETNGTVTWGGTVSCKDGPQNNRCEFNLTTAGATVTANP